MTCAPLDAGRWRLGFSEPEAAFLVNVLTGLARHYANDLTHLPPALRAYWQGSISAGAVSDDLRDAQEMLSDSRQELRTERGALAENWIREYELAEERDPWQVEISSAERDDLVAMLNDRRLTLALEIGISDTDMEIDPSHISQDGRRAAILEIDVLGHFILVALGPQTQRP
jgi:hypothetical protein